MTFHRVLAAATTPAPVPTDEPAPTGEPAPAPADPAGLDAGFNILGWIIANPWWALGITVVVLVAAKIGIDKGWEWLTLRYNIAGKPLNKLSVIIANTRNLMYSEDIHPVFLNNPKLAEKYPNFTWVKFWRAWTIAVIAAAAAAIVLTHTITLILLGVIAFVGLLGVGHLRQVATFRHQLLMQMFEVAQVQFRYAGGAELNPWAYIIVSEWNNVYFPSQTTIMIPAKVRKDDARVQKAFEEHFSSTVSDQYTWTFEWAPAANKVTCTPVPKLPEAAPYPFPDTHPWDQFPLGLTLGGGEATWTVSTFPHLLVAGTTGSGKLLELSSPIPTPTGWTTMGDIKVGDQVLDENGKPCTVVGLSDINEQPDLYRVTFSDGSFLDADGDHLWWTETRQVRESRWNAARKTAARRPLLAPAAVARLREAAAMEGDKEIRLLEAAKLAGVSETLPWVVETAAAVGHTGEVQIVTEFEYAEQVVVQQQKVTEYPARAAWSALAGYTPKVPAWYAHRARCAELAATAGADDTVSSRDVAEVLGVPAKKAGMILRDFGVSYEVSGGAALFPAGEAWQAIADAKTLSERVSWLDRREAFASRAAAAGEGEIVTSIVLADALGYEDSARANQWMERLKVAGTVVKRPVEVRVPAKTVRRAGRWARTYPAAALLNALADRGESFAHDQRHKQVSGGVRTTREILATLRTSDGHANHAIPVAKPLDLPDAELPIHPYLFGVWLGDGSSRYGKFYGIDHEIADHLRADGHQVTGAVTSDADKRHPDYRIWTVEGLGQQLRAQNLLQRTTEQGTRKRIPAVYLRASIAQRRALLAGLLDTDGTVAPQGAVQFTNTNRALAFGVHELAVSLGYRATILEGRATLNGVDYGPKWTVSWTCAESPFRLARKTRAHVERNGSYNAQRNDFRYIVSVEPIPSVPGRCLMVDSPNRLFLAGRNMVPTHNSVTQRTILLHALQSPDWRVILVDPKRVELSAYRDHPNVLRVAVELDESLALIEQLEREMQSRYVRMQEAGVNHFKQLETPLPAVLCMVDETFSLLAPTGIKSDEGKEQDAMKARIGILLSNIARLGRAAGIHLILATQRPDAKVLPGELKANLDARIAQGRMDTTPSLMTLDSDAATRIPPIKGRAVARMGRDTVEFQAYFLSEKDLSKTLALSKSLAAGDQRLLELAKARQGGVEPGTGGGDGRRRLSLPRFSMPRVSLSAESLAGLRERFAAWVEKRQAIVDENEARAGRTVEAREERAKKREAARNPAMKRADREDAGAVPGGVSSVAEVAEAARAKGITSSGVGLFDKAEAAGGSPELFAAAQAAAQAAAHQPVVSVVPDVPVASPGYVAAPVDEFDGEAVAAEMPATPVDAAHGGYVPVVPVASEEPVMVDVVPVAPAAGVSAPAAAAPAASGRAAAGGLSVAEVLSRAQERGVKIPASELLAALRAEAMREQQGVSAVLPEPAPAPAPAPAVPVAPVAPVVPVAPVEVQPVVQLPVVQPPVVEAPVMPVPMAAEVPPAAPAVAPAVPAEFVAPVPPPAPRSVAPVIPPPPAAPAYPWLGDRPMPGDGGAVPPAVVPPAAPAAVPLPSTGDVGPGPVRPPLLEVVVPIQPVAPATPVAPVAPVAPVVPASPAAAGGANVADDADEDGPPPFSAPWMPTEIYRPPSDRPSPFAPPPQR
jgi:hypothetical protein